MRSVNMDISCKYFIVSFLLKIGIKMQQNEVILRNILNTYSRAQLLMPMANFY